jgi:hypothetical protein
MKPNITYFEQRVEESTYDLYETITSITKIQIAKIIDYAFFATGLTLFVIFTIQSNLIANAFVYVSVILYLALFFILKTLLRGQTLGYFIMGIRFVNVRSKEPVTMKQYVNYVKKSTKLEVRYNEIIRYYMNYDSKLNQNQPMKRFGMVLVEKSKYKRFYDEYQYNLEKLQQLQQQSAV